MSKASKIEVAAISGERDVFSFRSNGISIFIFLDETSFYTKRRANTTTDRYSLAQRSSNSAQETADPPARSSEEQNDERPEDKKMKREREREKKEESWTNLRGLTFVVAPRSVETYPSGIVGQRKGAAAPLPRRKLSIADE